MRKTIVILSAILLCIVFMTECREKSMKPDSSEMQPDAISATAEDKYGEGKAEETVRETDQSQAEKDLIFLTSEECAGRQAGTPGNERAAEYMIKRYEEIGLAPFGTDYRSSYQESVETIGSDRIKLEILENDVPVEELTFGKDFIEVFLNDADLTLPLLEEPGDADCAVLAGDLKEIEAVRKNPKVKLILRLNDSYRRAGNFYIESGILEVGIFPDSFEQLKKQVGKSVHFSVEVDTEDKLLDNVVGMLKGTDSSHAVIISAHFDHAGKAGETVWTGAYDNASGVCVLLEAANALQKHYQDSPPPCDILFCAFNSEENLRVGSAAFHEQIKDDYEAVFDINLDCVGAKDAASLNVIANENEASEQIQASLVASLSDAGLGNVTAASEGGASDHQSFPNAVCLSTITDMASSKIHTMEDVPERIDPDYLVKLGGGIASFLIHDLDVTDLFSAPRDDHSIKDVNQNQLTVSEFEEYYQCKLDFADDRLLNILVISQKGSYNPPLAEARLVFLFLAYGQYTRGIQYLIYDKNDSIDMWCMSMDLEALSFDEDYTTSPIMINDSEYYLSDEIEESTRYLMTAYENDGRIVRVAVALNGSENDKEEDYINDFQRTYPEEYISGMADLLLSYSPDTDE